MYYNRSQQASTFHVVLVRPALNIHDFSSIEGTCVQVTKTLSKALNHAVKLSRA